MADFNRFAQHHPDGTYKFSNVREGLIVGMLSIGTLMGHCFLSWYLPGVDENRRSYWELRFELVGEKTGDELLLLGLFHRMSHPSLCKSSEHHDSQCL